MSDRERFLAFLHGAGFHEETPYDGRHPPSGGMRYVIDEGDVLVGNNGDETGYCGFYSDWHFDEAGKFVGVSHFE